MHFTSYYQAFVAILSLSTLIGTANAYAPPPKVDLRSCKPYAVVAGAAVTNGGPTMIVGDLALSPGNLVTGFPAGEIIGTMHITGSLAEACKLDLNTAMIDANGRAPNQQMTGELGGMTLAPGVYKSSSGYAITGTLFLDGQNAPDAAWIFIMASTLVVNTGGKVIMMNYDTSKGINVWWSCGSSASIFVHATIHGTIMAYASISAMAKATTGPLMARLGQVTLLSNAVHSYEFGQYASPTSQPSTQPTSVPTAPSAVPTAVPSSPTAQPTANPTTKKEGRETANMEVEQKVTGASAEQYNDDKAANDLTLQHALSENVDGVAPEEVTGITATEPDSPVSPTQSLRLLGAAAPAASVPTFLLSYKMTSHDPNMNYEKLAAQLIKAVVSGKLLASLRKYAAIYGADEMLTVSLAVPLMQDASPESDSSSSSDKLSGGAIAGIVIGCVVGVALLGFLVFLILHTSSTTAKHASEAVPTTEVATSA